MIPKHRICVVISVIGLITALILPASAGPNLKVLDPAPEIKVAKWVKGQPIQSFKKGKVYVVEFWATWCGPCRESIPHLTELAHKYAGKVTFAGISVWEDPKAKKNNDSSYMSKVSDFVTNMGAKMDYSVAVDGPEGTMAETWMTAADQNGIPTAFVIDRRSLVAWIGHPMAELDEVLDQVLQGTFNARGAARLREAREAKNKRIQLEISRAASIIQRGNIRQGLAILDRLIEEYPEQKSNLLLYKFSILVKVDESEAYRLAKTLGESEFKNSPILLNQIAWTIAEGKGLKTPDYAVAVSLAQRAVELTNNKNALILDTLGLALFNDGQITRAIEVQEQAVSVLASSAGVDENTRREITERLATFKKARSDK